MEAIDVALPARGRKIFHTQPHGTHTTATRIGNFREGRRGGSAAASRFLCTQSRKLEQSSAELVRSHHAQFSDGRQNRAKRLNQQCAGRVCVCVFRDLCKQNAELKLRLAGQVENALPPTTFGKNAVQCNQFESIAVQWEFLLRLKLLLRT